MKDHEYDALAEHANQWRTAKRALDECREAIRLFDGTLYGWQEKVKEVKAADASGVFAAAVARALADREAAIVKALEDHPPVPPALSTPARDPLDPPMPATPLELVTMYPDVGADVVYLAARRAIDRCEGFGDNRLRFDEPTSAATACRAAHRAIELCIATGHTYRDNISRLACDLVTLLITPDLFGGDDDDAFLMHAWGMAMMTAQRVREKGDKRPSPDLSTEAAALARDAVENPKEPDPIDVARMESEGAVPPAPAEPAALNPWPIGRRVRFTAGPNFGRTATVIQQTDGPALMVDAHPPFYVACLHNADRVEDAPVYRVAAGLPTFAEYADPKDVVPDPRK